VHAEDLNGATVHAAVKAGVAVRSSGLKKKKHLARCLKKMAKRLVIFKPKYVQLHVRRSKHDATVEEANVGFVDPCMMAKVLFEQTPQMLLGKPGQASTFWQVFRLGNPTHPLFLDLEADLDLCFPYALHGDEGSGLAEVPTLVISWQPIMAHDWHLTQWSKRFLIALCPKRRMARSFAMGAELVFKKKAKLVPRHVRPKMKCWQK
jgi:hypothetical protein